MQSNSERPVCCTARPTVRCLVWIGDRDGDSEGVVGTWDGEKDSLPLTGRMGSSGTSETRSFVLPPLRRNCLTAGLV